MSAEAFYEALKAKFDASVTLVPSPFAKLYAGEAPEGTDYPYCVMTPAEESKLTRTFGSKYFRDTFRLHIYDHTLELVGAHIRKIDAVFDDRTLTLSPSGATFLSLDKEGESTRQASTDVWEAILTYVAQYSVAR